LMKNVSVSYIKVSTLKFSEYTIQTRAMYIIQTSLDGKIVNISGKKEEYLKAKIDLIETNSRVKISRHLERHQ